MASMDEEVLQDQKIMFARLKGIHLSILSEDDAKTMSAKVVETVQEVTDAALGLPSLNSSECFTCGATNPRACEGHFGLINLPYTVFNPYYISEIAQLLNKICPGCKSVRHVKVRNDDGSMSNPRPQKNCKYCCGRPREGYPKMRFRVSSKDVFARTAIIAEFVEPPTNRMDAFQLAPDYWDVIPIDLSSEQTGSLNKRVLLPSQVFNMLQGVCSQSLESLLKRKNSIFLNSMLLTPNSHRLRECAQRMTFDETTPIYRRIVDFRGSPNELTACILERYKASKVRSEKMPNMDPASERQSGNDPASSSSGLKNIKELLLAKRTDNTVRMVVVGDAHIRVDEIGLPAHVAHNLRVPDFINLWNWERLEPCCDLMLFLKGTFNVHRKDKKVSIWSKDMLQVGDKFDRPLIDGDIVLINRPPSIHQHSLIALSVKVLSTKSVISINPLVCSPLRGDFDGDCIHGFIPQSLESRIELDELVSLRQQLTDGQNGHNLLSFGQDSLTAAYLMLDDGVTFNKFEMQQLQMFCSEILELPAIVKAGGGSSLWTGKQLFSLLLPWNFSYAANGVSIVRGELVMARRGASWLRQSGDNLYNHFIKHCPEKFLDFLQAGQEMLCEWLTKRGLSVSLSDLYLASDSQSRANLLDEVSYGLREAEELSEINLLMVDHNREFLMGYSEDDEEGPSALKKPSSTVGYFQASAAFKMVSGVMQSLVYKYSANGNSFVDMLKAGSKGNLQKLVQHSMCLGLQHSLSPLSFTIPREPSCASWNEQKKLNAVQKVSKSSIPFAMVAHSFLAGLNPLECFVGSLTARDSSFSGNADVSGTISRRIMFFMRDLVVGYDGTVRSSHGNRVVQFDYCGSQETTDATSGQPVGSLAACAISEAAYGALDLPATALETSPLLSLKEVLECGAKRSARKSASLFLSSRLRRWANGFEYGALEVKDHLEALFLEDIVSEVKICYSEETNRGICPWVCHFHIDKEGCKERKLKLRSMVDALYKNCDVSAKKSKVKLPKLCITSKVCSGAGRHKTRDSNYCISVSLSNRPQESSDLDVLSDLVKPVLLRTVIKGFPEFKKVEILWKDDPNQPKASNRRAPSGELFLRVSMSAYCDVTRFWSILQDSCIRISDIIDWERSHPDEIRDVSVAFGIDAAWNRFVTRLDSAVSDTGKKILPQHLVVTANCLSMTGEFVPLNAKGLANQRKELNVSSPFSQACFSSPNDCLVKAAKMGQIDGLQGSVEALAWGQTPPIGTGAQFKLEYNNKRHMIDNSKDACHLLRTLERNAEAVRVSDRSLPVHHLNMRTNRTQLAELVRQHFSEAGLKEISRKLRRMLRAYPVNSELSGEDRSAAMRTLYFHPRWEEKVGTGILGIKIGLHPEHKEKCYFLVRNDGSQEDFSYHKCIRNALRVISPGRANRRRSPNIGRETTNPQITQSNGS